VSTSDDAEERPSVGAFIRRHRQLAKLSLRDLASASSVSNAYLSQVERGLHQPSIRVLRAIADALEVSGEQLLVQAGLAPERQQEVDDGGRPTAVERAIAADAHLDTAARRSLLLLYRRIAGLE
jgi:transcriptional regulator with XRE-family HTH domain